MKRRLALVALGAAAVASIASISFAATSVVVSDSFDSGGYAGSTGTPDGAWVGPWTEIGENDGPTEGSVRVKAASGCSSKCLAVSGSLLFLGSGVSRVAEVPGANTVTLSYSTHFEPLTTAILTVQANPDGSGWKTLATRAGTGKFTDTVGSVGGTLAVRFTVTGLGLTGSAAIDDVGLSFVPAGETTTTIGLPIPPITLPTVPTVTTLPQTTTTTGSSPPTTTLPSTDPASQATRPTDTSTTTTTRGEPDAFVAGRGGPSNDGRGTGDTTGGSTDVEQTRPDGVIMHLDPGLMPMAMLSDEEAQVVAGLSVPFGMRSERLSLDLTLYVILGLTLAAVSALRFELTSRK